MFDYLAFAGAAVAGGLVGFFGLHTRIWGRVELRC